MNALLSHEMLCTCCHPDSAATTSTAQLTVCVLLQICDCHLVYFMFCASLSGPSVFGLRLSVSLVLSHPHSMQIADYKLSQLTD